MEPAEQLAQSFCCVKCQGKQASTRCVTLSGGLPHILALSQGKYVLVSCALCGYTEMYSLAAYALNPDKAPAANSPVASEG